MTPCWLLAWWCRTAETIVEWTLRHHGRRSPNEPTSSIASTS